MKVLVKPIKNVESLSVDGYCDYDGEPTPIGTSKVIKPNGDICIVTVWEDEVNSDDQILF